MSRRKGTFKREVVADPIYNEVLITKFVNKVMYDGKKSTAFNLVYKALNDLKGKVAQEEPLAIFKKAIENCKPQLEVRSRRVGGATYQVPVDVRPTRRTTLAINWIVDSARERGEKDMSLRLAAEIVEAFNNRGNAIKKKEDVHRMADANRAFSHYNW